MLMPAKFTNYANSVDDLAPFYKNAILICMRIELVLQDLTLAPHPLAHAERHSGCLADGGTAFVQAWYKEVGRWGGV